MGDTPHLGKKRAKIHPRWVDTEIMLSGLDLLREQGYTFHALVLSPPTIKGWPGSTCLVQSVEVPVGSSLEDALATELAFVRARYDLAQGPEASDLALPAGPTQRIDYVTLRASGAEARHTVFLIDFEATLASEAPEVEVACFGSAGDDWLSIAESFEFLPSEG